MIFAICGPCTWFSHAKMRPGARALSHKVGEAMGQLSIRERERGLGYAQAACRHMQAGHFPSHRARHFPVQTDVR